MNKSELRKRLRVVLATLQNEPIAGEIELLCDAVAVLDVFTPAERELVNAGLDWFHGRAACGENLMKAAEAVIAERTPPDPVETFIAEVRRACESEVLAWDDTGRTVQSLLRKLDAARGRK